MIMPASLPILYSFRRCPYAMRARLALAYSGIKCELREVDLKNKPQELRDISPKATVPALLLPDGRVIEQSLDIIHYALACNDTDGWLYPDKAQVAALIQKNDTEFVMVMHKYKYYERYPEASKAVYLKQTEEVFISWLEEILHSSSYIMGQKISIADIAIFPFIRQWALADEEQFECSPYVHIRKWLGSITNTALYERVMGKHTPWKQGDAVVLFP